MWCQWCSTAPVNIKQLSNFLLNDETCHPHPHPLTFSRIYIYYISGLKVSHALIRLALVKMFKLPVNFLCISSEILNEKTHLHSLQYPDQPMSTKLVTSMSPIFI